MKNKKYIFIILLICACFSIYYYINYSGKRNLETEDVEFSFTAKQLTQEFTANTDVASKKYLNKAIQVSGVVSDVKKNVITINETVSCQLQNQQNAKVGDAIVIKGRVTGYDDLFEQIKLDQCFIQK